MLLIFISKLSLKIYYINITTQKINNFVSKAFEIVLASFQIEDKL